MQAMPYQYRKSRMIRIALIAGAMFAAAAVLADPQSVPAHTVEAGDLMIIHPTARPNLPNRPTVTYVTISNDGPAADRLTGVSAPDFDSAEIHASSMTDGVMSMQRVAAVDLPAGEVVELAPGGYHIMLFGAKSLFRPGDTFPMVLTFEKQGEVAIVVMVEKLDPSKIGGGQMDHGRMKHGTAGNSGG
jgi:copper(I)-binding protein